MNSNWERSVPNEYMSRSLGSRTSLPPSRHDDAAKSRDELIAPAPNGYATQQQQPLRNSYNEPLGTSFHERENAGQAATSAHASAYDAGRTMMQNSAPQTFLSRSLDGQAMMLAAVAAATTAAQPQLGSSDRARSTGVEGEIEICKDELSRTKALLEQDKAASMRYVKEIDVLQRKNAEQVMQLQGLLNQSEQARRELEIQVWPFAPAGPTEMIAALCSQYICGSLCLLRSRTAATVSLLN